MSQVNYAACPVAGDGLTGSDMLDKLDAIAEAATEYKSRVPMSSRFAAGHSAPRLKPSQAPIQPGSTPASSNSSGRFLAYNQLGCVISRAVDDHHTVEVCHIQQQHMLLSHNSTSICTAQQLQLSSLFC